MTKPKRSSTNLMPSFLKSPKTAVIANKSFKRNWRILLSSCGRRESQHPPWRVNLCREKIRLTSSEQTSSNMPPTLNSDSLKTTSSLNNRSTREHNIKAMLVRVHRDNSRPLNFRISKPKTGLTLMRATSTCLTPRVQAWLWGIKDRPVLKGIILGRIIRIMATSHRREIGKTPTTISNCWNHLRKRPWNLWSKTSTNRLNWNRRGHKVKWMKTKIWRQRSQKDVSLRGRRLIIRALMI